MTRAAVAVTRNFARNLDAVAAFLAEAGAPAAFDALLDELFGAIIPALEAFPELGRDFLTRAPSSRQARAAARQLRERLGREASLRELIRGDYLLLYARRGGHVYLLAIKHHRQLAFDLPALWEP